jgi:hypothetical protein
MQPTTEPVIESLSIEIARSQDDLMGAFRLVYDSYLRAGLIQPSQDQIRVTAYHLLPTTEVFIAKCGEEVVSTLSLMIDGKLGIPMEQMYPEEVNSFRARGLKVAEVGCLADRRQRPSRYLETFFQMTRLMAQAARYRGVDMLIAAMHPRHAHFYKKLLGFRPFGNETQCPYVSDRPAVALYLDFGSFKDGPSYEKYFGEPLPIETVSPSIWDANWRASFKSFDEQFALIENVLE